MLVRILLIAALLWPGFAPVAAASVYGTTAPAVASHCCCALCVHSDTGGCACSVEQAPAEPVDATDLGVAPDTPRMRLSEPSVRSVAKTQAVVRAWVASGVLDAQSVRAAAACAWFCCWQT